LVSSSMSYGEIMFLLRVNLNKRLLNILIPANRSKKKRLLIDLLLVAVVFGGYFWYTHWAPAHKLESEHYHALSTVSIEDTQDALSKAETLYQAYTAFWDVKAGPADKKLLLKIYSSRKNSSEPIPYRGGRKHSTKNHTAINILKRRMKTGPIIGWCMKPHTS